MDNSLMVGSGWIELRDYTRASLRLAALFLLGFVLAACGGGDDSDQGAEPESRLFSLISANESTLEPLRGTLYRLTLTEPWQKVAQFTDRPFHDAEQNELQNWVADWEKNGFAAVPPNAAVAFGPGDGNKQTDLAIMELSNPELTTAGALRFEAQFLELPTQPLEFFPTAAWGHTWLFVDNDAEATDEGQPTALFVLLAAGATLLREEGRDTYELTLKEPADVLGFNQSPSRDVRRQPLGQWLEEWEKRGFVDDPPNAGFTASANGDARETRWGLAELFDPKILDDGSVQMRLKFLRLRNGEAATFTSQGTGDISGELVDPRLFIDSAPPQPKCTQDHDCPGSAICESFGICRLGTCTHANDCFQSETCQNTWCVPTKTLPCSHNGDCTTPMVCQGDKSCGLASQSTAQLEAFSGTAGPQGISTSTNSSACVTESGDHRLDPKFLDFCLPFEIQAQAIVANLADALFKATKHPYKYTGQVSVFSTNESDDFANPSFLPSQNEMELIEAFLLDPFQIVETPFFNYSTRLFLPNPNGLDPTIAVPGFGGQYFPDPEPHQSFQMAFLEPRYAPYQELTRDNNQLFFHESVAKAENLVRQFGGGGGFGCYIGPVNDSGTLETPTFQVGGGFGSGLAPIDGLDMGFGFGANLCEHTTNPLAGCTEDPNAFVGMGGGLNLSVASLAQGDTSPPTRDEDTDGDATNVVTQSEQKQLTGAKKVYISCGFGGGAGFQRLPNTDGEAVAGTSEFIQLFGLGGGGFSYATLEPDNGQPPTSSDDLNHQIAQLGRLLSAGTPRDEAASASANTASSQLAQTEADRIPPDAQRGIFYGWNPEDKTFKKRVTGSLRAYNFIFEPYNLPVQNPSNATADNTYIPGSTSPAGMFFASDSFDLFVNDLDTMDDPQNEVGHVLYTLNPNPLFVEEEQKETFIKNDINETLLEQLENRHITVALRIPLFIQHDNTVVLNQAPIVTDNQELLDFAVRALEKYDNVERIIVGTARHPVIKGFDVSCNSYNYQAPDPLTKTQCGGYESTLTFDDYYQLLNFLMTEIDKAAAAPSKIKSSLPVQVALDQRIAVVKAADGSLQLGGPWLEETKISRMGPPENYPLSLFDYWTLKSTDTKAHGLKNFITELESDNVDLVPMFSADFVSDLPDGPLTAIDSWLTDIVNTAKPLGVGKEPPGMVFATGWHGADIDTFLALSQVQSLVDSPGYVLYIDELFDQPWKGLDPSLPGMPGAQCGHATPIGHLVAADPQGPPLPGQLPAECAPNFFVPTHPPGSQAQPPCLCLTNTTDYPATFTGFNSDITLPGDSGNAITVPPNRVLTFDKGLKLDKATDSWVPKDPDSPSFFVKHIFGKSGNFALAVTWKQWPFPLTCPAPINCDAAGNCDCPVPPAVFAGPPPSPTCQLPECKDPPDCPFAGMHVCEPVCTCPPLPPLGGAVSQLEKPTSGANGTLIPSLACVGVADAQNGAASANSAFSCDQVWFQFSTEGTYPPGTKQTDVYVDWANGECVEVKWAAKGMGYDQITGWELKTLEAPPPVPGQAPQNYAQAPIIMIPQEGQNINHSTKEVSASFRFCDSALFPAGLAPGKYWFRVQPVSGIPSVDAIDIEVDPVTVTKGPRNPSYWQRLGKFTVDFPDFPNPVVYEMKFVLPDNTSFLLFPPADNGISDITLPGTPQNTQGGGSAGSELISTLTVTFVPAILIGDSTTPTSTCTVPLVITGGMNEGDQDGQAKLKNGAAKNPEDACFLELGNAKLFINGSQFSFTELTLCLQSQRCKEVVPAGNG